MGSISHLWTDTNTTGVIKRRSFHREGNGRSLLSGGGGSCAGGDSLEYHETGMELSSLLTHVPKPHAKATMSAFQNLVLTLALPVPEQSSGEFRLHKNGDGSPTYGSKWSRCFKKRQNSSSEKKEKARADKAYMHATVSVAGVAAAILGITSKWAKTYPGTSNYAMPTAMTSAAELLAAHLVQLAHQTGADHPTLASTIQSGINVSTSTDLLTFTAAAASSLRAAAVLKDRIQKDPGAGAGRLTNIPDLFCKEGPLRKKTRRGVCWKHVNIYMNKESQIILKMKNKNTAASFFKSKTSVVYGVQEVISGRQGGELWFVLNTGNGFMEFLCETEMQKEKWVAWVKNLMHQASAGGHQLPKPSQKLKMS